MIEWAGHNPFYAVVLAWLALHTLLAIYRRTARAVMVIARGWPPEHLDADGDWKPDEEEDQS